VNLDIKAIFEGYAQGINHTATKDSPYNYRVMDYAFSREEQEEEPAKREILNKIKTIHVKAQSGSLEDYKTILFLIKQIEPTIAKLAGK